MAATQAARAEAQPRGGQPGGVQPGGGQRTPARGLRPGEEPPKGSAVLKGVVVAADTGAPIRRAQVRAVAPDTRRQPHGHDRRAGPLRDPRAGRRALQHHGVQRRLRHAAVRPAAAERTRHGGGPAGRRHDREARDRPAARQRDCRPHRRRVRRAAHRRPGAGAALRLRERRATVAPRRTVRPYRRPGFVPRLRPAAGRLRGDGHAARGPARHAAAESRRRAGHRLCAHLFPRHHQCRRRAARERGARAGS